MSEYISSFSFAPSLSDDALMTILPRHAARLYTGSKIFEYRKVIPRSVPRRIYLYETGGTAAVTGHIVVDDVLAGPPADVWALTGNAGTTRDSFDSYFSGRHVAYAFRVGAAVKYTDPIAREQIIRFESGFRVPQNFLYLQNLPTLKARLFSAALEQVFSGSDGTVRLCRVQERDRTAFVKLATEHVSKGYAETGRVYAETLLRINDAGTDPEGFLTESKHVRAVVHGGKRVGFVVLTFKLGGSLKTGPVILAEADRTRGIGKLLRLEIHRVARALGFRKVYATVPADNEAAAKYLLQSGYKIEAHLARPYHLRHDEFVFAALLDKRRGPTAEFTRPFSPLNEYKQIFDASPELTRFLRDEFSASYCRVTDEWAQQQIQFACGPESSAKPRYMFGAYSGELSALMICLPKRGGSTKLILLSKSGHRSSLIRLISFSVQHLQGLLGPTLRRLYTQVPSDDAEVINAFREFGCRPEGLIELPFNQNMDTVLLAKEIP